jgi:hypothetical protein
MYIVGSDGDDVNEYNLSTAWDVSTASFLQRFSIAGQDTAPKGLFFRDDGLKMYVIGALGDDVNEYDLSTAWDVSTASYRQNFSIASQDLNPGDVFFKPDGLKMYVIGNGSDSVFQYSTGSSTVNTITWSDNIQWAGGTAPSIDYNYSTDVLINFTTYDGNNWIGTQLSLDSRSS